MISLEFVGFTVGQGFLLLYLAHFQQFLDDFVGFLIVCAGEGWLKGAAVVDDDEGVVVKAFGVQGEPVFEGASAPETVRIFLDELDILDAGEGDAFAVGEGEVVALDSNSALSDFDVFVVVEDFG